MKYYLLIIISTTIFSLSNAQVVYTEFLNQDHKGTIAHPANGNGSDLKYHFEFISQETGAEYKNEESIQKIHYKLHLTIGANEYSFDVLIRNLLVSLYIEMDMNNGSDKSVVTAIYNKKNRWVKLKGIVPTSCKNQESKWSRLNDVSSFEQLLTFVISNLDENVDFKCLDDLK